MTSASLWAMQEKELQVRSKMHDIKERCEEKSKDLVAGFIGLFGKEGKIVSIIPHMVCVCVCVLMYTLCKLQGTSYRTE